MNLLYYIVSKIVHLSRRRKSQRCGFAFEKKIRENSAEKSHRTNNAHKLDNKNKKYRTMTLKYKTTTRRAKTIKNNIKIKNQKKKTRSIINTTPKMNKDHKKMKKGSQEGRKEKVNKWVPIKVILKRTGERIKTKWSEFLILFSFG